MAQRLTPAQRQRRLQRRAADRAHEERNREALQAQQPSEIAVVSMDHGPRPWRWYPRLRSYAVSTGFKDSDLAVRDALDHGFGCVQDAGGKVLARR